MSYSTFKTVNFGPGRSGLGTVGYTPTPGTRQTAGVSELAAGSGVYGALITSADGFAGPILWDTGQGASTVYAADEINPARVDMGQTVPDVKTQTVGGALNGSAATAFGKVIRDRIGKLLSIWAVSNTTATPSATFALDDPDVPTTKTPQ